MPTTPAATTRPRVDRCPGALSLHEAADGHLARVRLPGGRITGGQLAGLGAIAADIGSGLLELTSRANLQLRGLPAGSDVAERVAELGLLPSATHERVRNILAGPDLALDETVAELDRALQRRAVLADLPGRFLFAVGPVAGDPDVTLHDGLVIAQGRSTPGGVAEALDLAERFLAVRDGEWRLAELAEPLLDGEPAPALPAPARTGAGVRLGRLTSGQAAALGAYEQLVVTPDRGIVARGAVDGDLAAIGLVTDPASPWRLVTACAGRPRCAKSLADVQADATEHLGEHGSARIHWAGCDRCCGRTGDVEVTMIATPGGYRVA